MKLHGGDRSGPSLRKMGSEQESKVQEEGTKLGEEEE
jgi:hypothetical protein